MPPPPRHGILHKPSASAKFWLKSFHKSSVILPIFASQIMRDFRHFCAISVFSGHAISTENKIQLQTILKLLQLYTHLAYCRKSILQVSQRGKFKLYFPHCRKYQKALSISGQYQRFFPKNSFIYLTVEVLLVLFLLSTL